MDGLGLNCGIFLPPEYEAIKHKFLFPSAEPLNGSGLLARSSDGQCMLVAPGKL